MQATSEPLRDLARRILSVEFFDLSQPVGMMQGMAVKEILKNVHGKLLRAGVVVTAPIEIDYETDDGDGGYLLYLETTYPNLKLLQSIWLDDGCSVACVALNDGTGWQKIAAH